TGGTVNDDFTISGGSVSGVITGGTGTDTLTGDNTVNTWTVIGVGTGANGSAGDVNNNDFREIEILNGGNVVDTFNIQAVDNALTVNAGAGNDIFNVSSNAPTNTGNVNNIVTTLTLNGDGDNDTLNIVDASDSTDNTGTLTSTTITGIFGAGGSITYGTFEDLNITLGSGNDTFNIQSTAHSTTVNAGAGNDTVNLGSAGNSLDN